MTRRPSRPQSVALLCLGFVIVVGLVLLIISLVHGDSTKDVVRPGDPRGAPALVQGPP